MKFVKGMRMQCIAGEKEGLNKAMYTVCVVNMLKCSGRQATASLSVSVVRW